MEREIKLFGYQAKSGESKGVGVFVEYLDGRKVFMGGSAPGASGRGGVPSSVRLQADRPEARVAFRPVGLRRAHEIPLECGSSLILVAFAVARCGAQDAAPSTTSVPAKGGDLAITALGHASVQLEQGGKVILVDPVANQADLSKAKQADLILVTDIHPDHFDAAAIAKLRKPGAPVVVPPAVAAMKEHRRPDCHGEPRDEGQ